MRVSEWLETKGFAHRTYHGDLEDRQRKHNQRDFLGGTAELMLATPAFGLGVDKPDIRGVAHFEMPGSVEAYFQEVGRAGRDGKPSRCRLFYAQEDLETQMNFIETLTPDPDFVRATHRLLVQWKDRLNVLRLDDLREQLSFKNKRDYRLETALSFLDRWGVIRFPHRRLDQLEFLRDLEESDLSADLWKARKLSLQKKLMSLVTWFRSEDCRKAGIYAYFGWPNTERCGFLRSLRGTLSEVICRRIAHLPDPRLTLDEGILDISDDLRTERLLEAYSFGIFPWPHEDLPTLWYCPNERGILEFAEFKVATSLAKFIRKCDWTVTMDQAFDRVLEACAKALARVKGAPGSPRS